jgi:hypothetical protein
MGEPAAYRWVKPTAAARNTTSWQPAAYGLPKSASPGLWGLQPCGTGACPGPKREMSRGLANTTGNEPLGPQVHRDQPP